MNTKYHKEIYDNTIAEVLFLCEVLIGNEAEEDVLLVSFYRGLFAEGEGRRHAKETDALRRPDGKALIGERLLPMIHAHLGKRRGFGNEPPDAALLSAVVLHPAREKQAESLIASCYRERRAVFLPDPARVRRLYAEIRNAD